jgi:DNA polymerase
MSPALSPEQILRWHIDAGADEATGERPVDRFTVPAAAPMTASPKTASPITASKVRDVTPKDAASPGSLPQPSRLPAAQAKAAVPSARLAEACATVEDLKRAVEAYDGCALKRSCQRTVFADGNSKARLMLVGEAPGREEDEQGLPFVGASGKLLDRMLASIGLDRNLAYITNVIFWRPPGNRKPEPAEVELCLPFMERHIQLVDPAVLVFLGGAAASALLGKSEGVTKLRGRWHDYSAAGLARPIPSLPTYHPAYLLRTPTHKKEAWKDLLAVRKRLDAIASTH